MTNAKLADTLSVRPQVATADVAGIAATGFRAIVCNRPDGEGADQPGFEEIEAAARAAGRYEGYGSRPLTVERGPIVLAEFGYGGVLQPSFPRWPIDGTRPSRLAWLLKERFLPPIYWQAMLRGREWMAKPEKVTASPSVPAA